MLVQALSRSLVVFAALTVAGVGLIVVPSEVAAFQGTFALQAAGLALFAAGLAFFLVRAADKVSLKQAVILFVALTCAGVGLIVAPLLPGLAFAAAILPLAGAAMFTAALTFFLVRVG